MKTRTGGATRTKLTVTQRRAKRSPAPYVTKKKHNVTDRKHGRKSARARAAPAAKPSLIAKVMDHLAEAVVILDAEFRVASVNPAFTAITGYTAKDVTGRAPPFLPALRRDKGLYAAMRTALAGAGRWEGEVWDARRNGEAYAERLSIAAIADDDGRVQHYAAVITDVTRRKQDEERIRYQANFDALTGLPNRALFLDRLTQALPTMARAGARLGLMFIDLDGFKLVNDTLGHDFGDHLLREAAVRLGKCVRSGDTVARLGGDEFTVIMPNLHEPRDAPLVANRVLEALAKPFDLKGHEAFVSASIGITIFPDDARDANGLLRNADTAMYRAKEQGKANFQFYTADLNREVKERLIVKNGLGKALERNEFSLYYQPKLDLKSGRITSVEALMRWHNRDLGMVSPARFIPVLEETGLVVEVGAWAIRTACAQHKAWKDAGLPPLRVAVNLSARQLREISFVSVLESALKESGVGPNGLEIEITESMLMSDSARTVVALRDLSDMGVRIAMDDFGTGYSSLSYLRRFPIDTIKIDRSFVADIVSNPDDAEIIRTIITMGQTLNRWIVAEGVETEEQMALLKGYTCDEIQGYYLSPPLPADKLTRFMQERMPQAASPA
jgi:diguanylate cyclase (GGDEF)-like protein/PAS domain S-box-containing protein